MKWQVIDTKKRKPNDSKEIIKILLKNRGIKNEKEFFNPKDPKEISLKDLKVDTKLIKKAIERIEKAKEKKEKVIIYGDYDADGVTATAIMWEALYSFGLEVLPYIPDRFEEGYGLNSTSLQKLKEQNPELKLVVTVDNGIVAYGAIKKAKELGIDVIVVDHHAKGSKKNTAYSVIHNSEVCGSALCYFFAKEFGDGSGLELATIGTIADQMPLVGVNRSIVKFGLKELTKTKRPGLLTLFKDSGIKEAGTYEVNYIIAPRINAMGRLSHAIDSLRLLCTKDLSKSQKLSKLLNDTNKERQTIVEKVTIDVRKNVTNEKVIVLAHSSYHEGVIGLAAGRLVEEFYRPSIVLAINGDTAKASARSIAGFNIIEAIKKLDNLITAGGGHPMAAGFSIATKDIEEFKKRINEVSDEILNDEILERKLKIDTPITFEEINEELVEKIKQFEPYGNGNYAPVFVADEVEILEAKKVGTKGNHVKLKLSQGKNRLEAIHFNASNKINFGELKKANVAFSIEENIWNGNKSIQLKVKDLHQLD